jgi:hypothetical protein
MFEHATGLVHFYREAMKTIQTSLTYFATDDGGARPLRSDTLDMLPYWLENPRANRGIYSLSLESGSRPNEPSDKAFFFLADEEEEVKTGIIRLVLPPAFVEGKASDVLDLVTRLVDKLEFESGHAGYSVNWDQASDTDEEVTKELGVIAKKYPGVDVNYFNSTLIAFQNSTTPSIKCVNWLTLIGQEIRESLPPPADLSKDLGEQCRVQELTHGLVLQAGSNPTLGYPERDELEPYRQVGRILAEFRLTRHPQILPVPVPGEDPTEDWLSRFD